MSNLDEDTELYKNLVEDMEEAMTTATHIPDNYLTNVIDISTATITAANINSSNLVINKGRMDDYFMPHTSFDWAISSKPFVNYLPNPEVVEKMCEEYPALKKAYENFKTVYQMVEQDWKGKQDE